MSKKSKKGHITRTRNRYAKEVATAWATNQKCYIALKITDGPSHAEIQEDWWEQRVDCRSSLAIGFNIAGIEGEPFIRSERHYCICAQDPFLSNSELRRPLSVPAATSPSDSCLWHFGGAIVFPGEITSRRTAFCEYNPKTRKGVILVTFDGWALPALYQRSPQSLQDVRAFKAGEYKWLCSNW